MQLYSDVNPESSTDQRAHLVVTEALQPGKGRATPDSHSPGVDSGNIAALGRPLHEALSPETALVHLQAEEGQCERTYACRKCAHRGHTGMQLP